MRLPVKHCGKLIKLSLVPISRGIGTRCICIGPGLASGALKSIIIAHAVGTVFPPYRVVADVRPLAQCAAVDVERNITAAELGDETGNGTALSTTLPAMCVVDDGRPEQTFGQVNEVGQYFTDESSLVGLFQPWGFCISPLRPVR